MLSLFLLHFGRHIGTMTFPSDWVDCPPAEAEDANGLIFRVVKTDPPTMEDMKTYEELGIKYGPLCKRRGLSVFKDVRAAMNCVDLFGQFGNLIAAASLNPEHGKVGPTKTKTQPEHHTWWPCQGIDRVSPFTCVNNDV